MKTLYLYDFDGTITNKDSLFEFLNFATPSLKYKCILLRFAPLFVGAKLGVLDKGKIKQGFISTCLKGKSKEEISGISQNFLEYIQKNDFFKKNALASIKKHTKEGDVFIVSASLDLWLEEIAIIWEYNLFVQKLNLITIFSTEILKHSIAIMKKSRNV